MVCFERCFRARERELGRALQGPPGPNARGNGILLTQVEQFPSGIYEDFWTSVYQAIDD
jgi:hypothetical protein